ncbi:unnamed protein product [Calypogeia fissa]
MDFLDEGDADENHLQACYVLHGLVRDTETGEGLSTKAGGKRKCKDHSQCESLHSRANESPIYGQRRCQAFNTVWGRIRKLIEDIMEDQNQDIYEEMQQWICNRQYGDAQLDICQNGNAVPLGEDARQSAQLPTACSTARKQLQTALLFLGGVDPSDHEKTFDGLVGHLRMHRCHVARLTSLDFSLKAGVAGLLRVLFRQLIMCSPETTDMEILRAWHREPNNHGIPVVFVIENAESCESKVLAELILLLSDWIGEIPMVLIMGMATTDEAIRRLLPSNAVVRLRLWRFSLKSPHELLEVVMRAVMIDSFCALELSHEVVAFLYSFFRCHDLTVTAISRAFKVACMEHFWKEPLSFLCGQVLKNISKTELEEECAALPKELLKHAAKLPSVKRFSEAKSNDLPLSTHMAESLWQLRAHRKMWAIAFLCLQCPAKHAGISFSELLNEALAGSFLVSVPDDEGAPSGNGTENNESPVAVQNRLPMDKVMSKLREMPPPVLKSVLEEWRTATIHEKELNADVCKLLSDFDGVDKTARASNSPESAKLVEASSQDFTIRLMNRSKLRRMGQQQQNVGAQRTAVNAIRIATEKLLRRILREFLVPPDWQPFSEVFCFKDVAVLKGALIGDTRRKVHMDLLNSREVLKCKCCPSERLCPSLHDTTLAYALSQEHGDLIQVHTWYRSFAAILDPPISGQEEKGQAKGKGRGRKKKGSKEVEPVPPPVENVSIDARFTRAATELQIVGLLQLPKKGQSDSVRRICL